MFVYLAHGDRFPANHQQISLRGMHIFIEIDPKSEEHIIRIERLPVRKFQSPPEHDCVRQAVWRDLPGLGQCRFRLLRRAVNMDEVGLHYANHFAGSRISGDQGIQSLRFAAERYDQAPSCPAHFSREHQ